MKCRLTKYEKETIILFNEAEPTAKIIVQNAENALKALTIQEIYVIIKLYNFLQKGLDRLCWLA